EIRSQVWLECLAVLCPADPRQTDQICATLDCFCGHRYKAFNSQMLPLLLANKRIYADVSTLLGTGTTRRKHTLAFCSPGCAAYIIPRMGRLQMNMVKAFEVRTYGVWGV